MTKLPGDVEVGPRATREHYQVDRSGWPKGPWDKEPEDRIEWRDDATGLPCLMVRIDSGSWCGYVAVPKKHPWYGLDYEKAMERHGGTLGHGELTYCGRCQGVICHTVEPGEAEDVWWFGFDCAHCYDAVPTWGYTHQRNPYRTREYVRGEVAKLAGILAKVRS